MRSQQMDKAEIQSSESMRHVSQHQSTLGMRGNTDNSHVINAHGKALMTLKIEACEES